jgi:hypothetical protein
MKHLARWQGALLLLVAVASLGESCQPWDPPRLLREGPPPSRPCAVSLQWDPPAPPPPTNIREYAIYRDGIELARQWPIDLTYEDPTWLDAGESYEYRVAVIDWNGRNTGGVFRDFQPVACPPPAPDPSLRTLVLLVKFSDFAEEPFGIVDAQAALIESSDSLATWWETNSYGRQTLDIDVFPVWIQLGVPIAGYCMEQDPSGLWSGCNTLRMVNDTVAVLDSFYSFAGIERLVVAFTGLALPGVAIHADTEEGSIPAAVVRADGALGYNGRKTVAHELGHLAGLPHAQGVDCPDGGFPPNPFVLTSGGCSLLSWEFNIDPMGVSGTDFYDQFNAFYKERLGFIGGNRIDVIPATSAGSEVVLYSLQDDIDGRQMIKIPTTSPPAKGAWYFVEYRPRSLARLGYKPVIVRLKSGVGAQSLYGINLGPGESFVDPVQGIRITARSPGTNTTGDFIYVRVDNP